METALYKITFNDGRIFKVICMNKTQNDRIYATATAMLKHDPKAKVEALECGIHNVTQWEQIVATLSTNK